jgi:hypothetical protein
MRVVADVVSYENRRNRKYRRRATLRASGVHIGGGLMSGFERLELSTETLRDLTRDELEQVAGGAQITGACGGGMTQSPVCPSGATWFAPCYGESRQICDS